MSFTLETLGRALGQDLPSGGLEFSGIQFDSRQPLPGGLFVALSGSQQSGQNYVPAALTGGARMALVSKLAVDADPAAQIVTANPLAAIARLATLQRREVPIDHVIGITGSNGKTTTKEAVAAALEPLGQVAKSPASFNNEIGVPVTIAGIDPGARLVVVELGAQTVGEITEYCRIADPTDAIITNIGQAHIGLFGSQENIVFAKGELGAWLRPSGTLVLNADDPFSPALAGRSRGRVRWISARDWGADVSVRTRPTGGGLTFELSGQSGCSELTLPTYSPVVGLACAAAVAIAESLGVHIHDAASGMESISLPPRRMQVVASQPYLVIDDSYNANCESGKAALDALMALDLPSRRVAILGEMLELGDFSAASHHELGIAAVGLDRLLTIGHHARGIGEAAVGGGLDRSRWSHFACHLDEPASIATAREAALSQLAEILRPGDGLLVKGSNALALTEIANALA